MLAPSRRGKEQGRDREVSTAVDAVVADSAEGAAREVAERLAAAARAGDHIVLAGGATPRRAYELAAELQPDWTRAELWWGDERCVTPDDERSNFRLARESLLDAVTGEPTVHRIHGELGAARAADLYDAEIRGVALDLVLLGIGADGHTASLFPHSPALGESARLAVPVHEVEPERVTLTPVALGAARMLVFLAVGAEKADALARAFARPPDAGTPASLVRSWTGTTVLVADRAAAAGIGGGAGRTGQPETPSG